MKNANQSKYCTRRISLGKVRRRYEPGAEKGSEFPSRALSFLEKLNDCPNFSQMRFGSLRSLHGSLKPGPVLHRQSRGRWLAATPQDGGGSLTPKTPATTPISSPASSPASSSTSPNGRRPRPSASSPPTSPHRTASRPPNTGNRQDLGKAASNSSLVTTA